VSQIEMLEQNVKQLSPSELSAFRAWFMDFDAAEWDRKLETDSESKKTKKFNPLIRCLISRNLSEIHIIYGSVYSLLFYLFLLFSLVSITILSQVYIGLLVRSPLMIARCR